MDDLITSNQHIKWHNPRRATLIVTVILTYLHAKSITIKRIILWGKNRMRKETVSLSLFHLPLKQNLIKHAI